MLRLYDTRLREIAELAPATPGLLRLYSCGPTVYRQAHVGNMRSYLLNDLVVRVAALHGVATRLVVNITDVGHLVDDAHDTGIDKLAGAARAEGLSVTEIARFYEDAFHADLTALGVQPAQAYPRASETIPAMIELVERLLGRGHAYPGDDGTVFFDARSFPGYGELSGNRLADLRPAAGEAAPGKRFHADWALWKPASPEAAILFDSPFGRGFPGWHLECSAMSLAELGETIDLHTGGIDLRFPHHEDERAQTEAAVGHPVVRRWAHGEHLLLDGRKMSKSTGNVVLVRDLPERGLDPLALRLAFLSFRYRQQASLSWESLGAAEKTLRRWRARVAEWAESPSAAIPPAWSARLRDAFDDDLDTPAALVALRELERDPEVAPGAKFETFAWADRVLGLDLARDVGAGAPALPPGAAELLTARDAARAGRDFAASDRLREELAALGVAVRDTATGQTWTLGTR